MILLVASAAAADYSKPSRLTSAAWLLNLVAYTQFRIIGVTAGLGSLLTVLESFTTRDLTNLYLEWPTDRDAANNVGRKVRFACRSE